MSNPTSNFGWQMPTATDLVTDLPADFEVFGQAVDTALMDLKGGTTGQVLKKNTNADMDFVWSADAAGMTNPMTTTGDTIYSSSGSTPARLGIGSTGQVLTVSGGVPTWATAAAPSDTWSLLSTVTLSGLSSTTITSITSNKLALYMVGARVASGSPDIMVRPNNSTTAANYKQTYIQNAALSGPSYLYTYDGNVDKFIVGGGDDGNTSMGLWFQIQNCKSTSYKITSSIGGSRYSGAAIINNQGAYVEAAAVTSITLLLSSSSFNAGTLYVYGA